MAELNYRDAYVLVNLFEGKEVFQNDAIKFLGDDAYKGEDYIGDTSNYVEDVLYVSDYLYQLRKDKLTPTNCEKAAFVNSHDRSALNITSGAAVGTIGGFLIVYCGVVDLGDEYDTVNSLDYYDQLLDNEYDEDEECYTITEKGLKYLEEIAKQIADEICEDTCQCVCPEEREENSTMDNLFGNLGFGKLRGDRFKISMNGIAVAQPNGKYVVYNKDNNEFVDATNTLFEIKDALFLLPAVEVNVGDTVLHENKPYFIVDTTNEIKAVSYEDCTQTVLIPKSTMFGIKYFTKVFSMFGDNFAAAGDLFSNPMMLMALMEGKNSDLTQLMLMSSLNNGDLGSNPMALAMMLKGDKSEDSLSTIALMSMFSNGTNPFAPKKKETKKPESTRNN